MTYAKAEIRRGNPADAPVLFGFARERFGEEFAADRTLAVLEAAEVYVASVEGVTSGYVAVETDGPAAVVRQLFVAPVAEGAHVGHQLLDWVEGLAISRALRRVEVESPDADERAEAFYAGRGYRRLDSGRLARDLPGT